MKFKIKDKFSIKQFAKEIISGNRIILSKAITLVESSLPADNESAQKILGEIMPHTGTSIRVGITGVPGVGKSTFIEALGKHITSLNKKLAVLALDPSSKHSKGSILGDKTRMEELSNDPLAYIRPSPTKDLLGGISAHSRETMLLCEAAGFEVIFIETVGVGQSETSVHGMVDFFLLLMLAGAGDELQGIKKGIMEMADAMVITKADGNNVRKAELAKKEYQNALHLYPLTTSGWVPPVTTCSAINNKGIKEIWEVIIKHHETMKANGYFDKNRQQQNLEWMHETVRQHLQNSFYSNKKIKKTLKSLENQVMEGKMPAINAALKLLEAFKKSTK